MKSRLSLLILLLALSPAAIPSGNDGEKGEHAFKIYDNMFYRGKPNTAPEGMVVSNILYEDLIWPHDKNYGKLPSRGISKRWCASLRTVPIPARWFWISSGCR